MDRYPSTAFNESLELNASPSVYKYVVLVFIGDINILNDAPNLSREGINCDAAFHQVQDLCFPSPPSSPISMFRNTVLMKVLFSMDLLVSHHYVHVYFPPPLCVLVSHHYVHVYFFYLS